MNTKLLERFHMSSNASSALNPIDRCSQSNSAVIDRLTSIFPSFLSHSNVLSCQKISLDLAV